MKLSQRLRKCEPAKFRKSKTEADKSAEQEAQEALRRTGHLIRLDGDLDGLTLSSVYNAYHMTFLQLSNVREIKECMQLFDRATFVATDRNYAVICQTNRDTLPSSLQTEESTELRRAKQAIITSVISYSAIDLDFQKEVTRLLPEGFRWPNINQHNEAMRRMRNDCAHSYRAPADNPFHGEFSSPQTWGTLRAVINDLYAEVADLERCLYRTVLKLQDEQIFPAPSPSVSSKSSSPKPKLKARIEMAWQKVAPLLWGGGWVDEYGGPLPV